MIASLLQIAVLSDVLKDEVGCDAFTQQNSNPRNSCRTASSYLGLDLQCGSLQEALWRCDWTAASQPTHRKMLLLTTRAQRFARDGVAAAGMQDRISMLTFVQAQYPSVLKSPICFEVR